MKKPTKEDLGITDKIMGELWVRCGAGYPDSLHEEMASSSMNARVAVLQHEAIIEISAILERNEESSNRMLYASYIMLAVAVMTLIATVVSIFK